MENNFDIAIIGLACRFPGADNISEFWKNLLDGVESIRTFSDNELKMSGIPASLINNPHYIKASPVINDPEYFDASFFGYTPAEAKIMDPQHRVLLECAYEALDNSGYTSEKFSGRIGVFTGSAMNTYFMNRQISSKFTDEYIPTLIGNDKDFLSTKISYKLNLKGPSINVQTACSTSLVAVHLACQSLISQETDIVLAGAVSIKAPHYAGYIADGGGIVTPDGHVRAFDKNANGTVFGSGCGVVVLKRLSEAVNDGDTIHAVIKGSAVNNDGSEKAGYTAPAVNSQTEVIIEALSLADINAGDITYVEAHGSGTPIGDPIEAAAMTKAFRHFTDKKNFCAIGSVKTNIGHLDAAAGIASLIKTVLSLKNKKIPSSLNFSEPNPEIDFSNSPFFVNSNLRDWISDDGLRKAAVISTGMGGTNACLVLEEAPETEIKHKISMPAVFTISAKSEEAVDLSVKNLSAYLTGNEETDIHNAAYTLQTGRKDFNFRKFFVSNDRNETLSILNQPGSKKIFSGKSAGNEKRPVIFLLPGIGDHYVGMGYDLYRNIRVFREEVDKCAAILKRYLNTDIREILYPENYINNRPAPGGGIDLKKMLAGRVDKSADAETQKLNQTLYVQPALFTIEYALSKFWIHLGIVPDAIVGHSMGEYVAACLSGVISLEDALKLIASRARMVNNLPQGAMLAVSLTEDELTPLLNNKISISLINSPDLCVVAGTEKDIADFEEVLIDKKILYRPIQNGHAFHSKMLDPIQKDFINEVSRIRLNSPSIPYTSNLTGDWINGTQAADPVYWGKHSNTTARFSDALDAAWKIKNCILVEMGPGNTLSVLAMKHPSSRNCSDPATVSTLRPQYDNQSDLTYMLTAAGKLWLKGVKISWEKLYDGIKPKRIPLPSYPFQRERFWIDPIPETDETAEQEVFIQKNPDIAGWYYVPSWKRMPSMKLDSSEFTARFKENNTWLVFTDSTRTSDKLIEKLRHHEQVVVVVRTGNGYSEPYTDEYTIAPGEADQYNKLVKSLTAKNRIPRNIIHAWSISEDNDHSSGKEFFNKKQDLGFYSLIYLVKALGSGNILDPINLYILSNNIHEVTGTELLIPEKSTALGPCMVIPQEHNNIRTRNIDIEINEFKISPAKYSDMLLSEFLQSGQDRFIALRNGFRWIQSYEQIRFTEPAGPSFRKNGVYLVTGGLGEVCYIMAKYLAETYKAKLVIVGLTELPETILWDHWLEIHDDTDLISTKIKLLRELESYGSEVVYYNINVAEEEDIRSVVDRIYERFGRLNGVIHGAGLVGEKGFSSIHDIDTLKCGLHFQSKVHGLYTLKNVLDHHDLDFCMLMSSLTPVLGGLRESAYSASNTFMDNFAKSHAKTGRTPWMSVNWDLWRTKLVSDKQGGIGKTLSGLGITAEEGIKVLETIIPQEGIPQVVISTGDLNARVNQWIRLDSIVQSGEEFHRNGFKTVSQSENISGTRSTQDILVQIWKELLGIEEVTNEDNFFELGGHSLLAIQLISSIRKAFQADVGLDDIFNCLTFSEMTDKINQIISIKAV